MNLEYLKYVEVLAHPSLSGIVAHYRVTRATHLSHGFVFPNYSPIFQGLIFNIQPLDDIILTKKDKVSLKHKVYFVGQAISPSTLASSSRSFDIIAVNFTPLGIFQLTGVNLNNFTNQIVDAEMVFGKEINELYEKIIESQSIEQAIYLIDTFLCMRAKNSKKYNKPPVVLALSILKQGAGGVNVKMLEKTTNTTSKTLERLFKSEIGMTPKMYQRLLRFNQAKQYMIQNQYTNWMEIVLRFGFYDQSHFISEFRFFSGRTPLYFLKELQLYSATPAASPYLDL